MKDESWMMFHKKSHCCQIINGEVRLLTRCGKHVHPMFLSQPEENTPRCQHCEKSVRVHP